MSDTGRPAVVPGLRNVDHLAFTVPDLAEAERFFGEVFGALPLYRQGPVCDADGDFMARQLAVHPRAECYVALLRLGPHANLELFEYSAPDQVHEPPAPAAPGGHHLAFRVNDLDAALHWLAERPDVRLHGGARPPSGAAEPGRWARLTTRWGMRLELVEHDPQRAVPGRYSPPDPVAGQATGGPASPAAAAAAAASSPAPGGLPTLAGLDHVGYTVPELDQAIAFLTGPLGGSVLVREFAEAEDAEPAGIGPAGPGKTERAVLRLGPVTTVVLRAAAPDLRGRALPRNSDVGGHHLACYVGDVDAAADFLRATPGARVLGDPQTVDEGGPIDGDRWVYFQGPWGFQFELLTLPEHLPYERHTAARRFGPAAAWGGAAPGA